MNEIDVKLKEPTFRIQAAIIQVLKNWGEMSNNEPLKKGSFIARVNLALYPYERITNERSLRLAIQWMRMYHPEGSLICSTMTNGGGYYLAASIDQLNEFMSIDKAQVRTISIRWNMQYKNAVNFLEPKPEQQLSLFDLNYEEEISDQFQDMLDQIDLVSELELMEDPNE